MPQFSDGHHTIHHGNAVEVLATGAITDGSVDLIFTDPPYNIGKDFNGLRDKWPTEELYLEWFESWLDLCLRKLKPTGSLYVMCATQCFAPIDLMLRKRLTILSRIVWSYDSSGMQAKKYYGSLWEPIFFCVKDEKNYTFNAEEVMVEAKTGSKRKLIDYRKPVPTPYNTKKVPGNVWDFARVRYRMPEYEEHPTQKPIDLLERVILASSNPGDLVLDPFGGTFTTGYVAKKHGRRSVSVEINEEYLKIGLRRLGLAQSYNGETLKGPVKVYNKLEEPIKMDAPQQQGLLL